MESETYEPGRNLYETLPKDAGFYAAAAATAPALAGEMFGTGSIRDLLES